MIELKPRELQILSAECQALARLIGDYQNGGFFSSEGRLLVPGKNITRIVNALLSSGNIFESWYKGKRDERASESPAGPDQPNGVDKQAVG